MFARIHRTIWLKCFILVLLIWVQSPYNSQHYDLCLYKTSGEQWWVAFIRGHYWDWHCLTTLSAPWTVSLSAPSANCSDKTRRNSFKLKEGVFGLAIRKKLKKDLKTLPREAVKIPSMEAFKARLVEAPAHGRGCRTKGSLRFLPIKIILQFYGSKKSISDAFVPSLHRQVHLPLKLSLPLQHHMVLFHKCNQWKQQGSKNNCCVHKFISLLCFTAQIHKLLNKYIQEGSNLQWAKRLWWEPLTIG